LVTITSDFFVVARNATYRVSIPETPMGQALAPPLSANYAKKITNVANPQITQENTCGLVFPCGMERIYDRKAINISAMATALKNALSDRTWHTNK